MNSIFRNMGTACLLAVLAACSGPIETRISSNGSENLEGLKYRLPKAETGQSEEYKQAQKLFDSALAEKGFLRSENADVLMTFTLSSRFADLSLRSADRVIGKKKKDQPLQNCRDKEFRMTLQLTQIASGKKLYDGEAAEYHCNAGFAETLPKMVELLVDDIGSQGGQKKRIRRGRE